MRPLPFPGRPRRPRHWLSLLSTAAVVATTVTAVMVTTVTPAAGAAGWPTRRSASPARRKQARLGTPGPFPPTAASQLGGSGRLVTGPRRALHRPRRPRRPDRAAGHHAEDRGRRGPARTRPRLAPLRGTGLRGRASPHPECGQTCSPGHDGRGSTSGPAGWNSRRPGPGRRRRPDRRRRRGSRRRLGSRRRRGCW